MLSFIFQFRDIVFRLDGSVLPFVMIEITIALILSFFALHVMPDEEFSHLGHRASPHTTTAAPLPKPCPRRAEAGGEPAAEASPRQLAVLSCRAGSEFVGMLVSFLAVFRAQSAWTIYMEGKSHVGSVVSASRGIANEILGGLVRAYSGRELPSESADAIRLLKLFYYVTVEHVRSSDGYVRAVPPRRPPFLTGMPVTCPHVDKPPAMRICRTFWGHALDMRGSALSADAASSTPRARSARPSLRRRGTLRSTLLSRMPVPQRRSS